MSLEDDIACLEAVPTLRVLGADALRMLAIGCESRMLDEGEVLFEIGDPADAAYVVQEGSFTLTAAAAETDAPPVGTAGPGALLGELAMLIKNTRPVTAIAAEPAAVVRISRHLFRKTLEGFPEAAERLRDHLAGRARQTAEEISLVGATLDPGADETES